MLSFHLNCAREACVYSGRRSDGRALKCPNKDSVHIAAQETTRTHAFGAQDLELDTMNSNILLQARHTLLCSGVGSHASQRSVQLYNRWWKKTMYGKMTEWSKVCDSSVKLTGYCAGFSSRKGRGFESPSCHRFCVFLLPFSRF